MLLAAGCLDYLLIQLRWLADLLQPLHMIWAGLGWAAFSCQIDMPG